MPDLYGQIYKMMYTNGLASVRHIHRHTISPIGMLPQPRSRFTHVPIDLLGL